MWQGVSMERRAVYIDRLIRDAVRRNIRRERTWLIRTIMFLSGVVVMLAIEAALNRWGLDFLFG